VASSLNDIVSLLEERKVNRLDRKRREFCRQRNLGQLLDLRAELVIGYRLAAADLSIECGESFPDYVCTVEGSKVGVEVGCRTKNDLFLLTPDPPGERQRLCLG
jgi:hypothetical protein